MPSETPNIDRCIDNYYALPEGQISAVRQAARSELAALREQVKQASNLLAVANDPDPLTNRLRGTYRLEDGSSRSFARFVPPIQVVAAAEIDRLRNEVKQARNAALDEAAKAVSEESLNKDIICPDEAVAAILTLKGP